MENVTMSAKTYGELMAFVAAQPLMQLYKKVTTEVQANKLKEAKAAESVMVKESESVQEPNNES